MLWALSCRRFNAQQAEESRESLLHTAPDNNLVNALIRAFVAHKAPACTSASAPVAAEQETMSAGVHDQHESPPASQADRETLSATAIKENKPHACSDRSTGAAAAHHSNGNTSATALQELNGREAQTDAAVSAEQTHLQVCHMRFINAVCL